MTDREVALVLPTETNIELLAEDVEVAQGYAELIMPCMSVTRR